MDVIYDCCAGIDVHKRTMVVCVIRGEPRGAPTKEIRTFGTMTADILEALDWLVGVGCTHVVMESTGVYWKPLYNLMDGTLDICVVNAQHIKAVPGRKTDVRDAEWLADLLRHGLVQPSFIPDRAQRELRELTRYRTTLIQERSAEVNRLQKTLEGANIKLAGVASDIMGVSGRAMLAALVSGQSTPTQMAQLAQGRLREKVPQIEQALRGQVGPHQRFLLAQQMTHIDGLDALIATISHEIEERVRPVEDAIERIDTVTGVGRRTAEILVAEIGTEMSRFPDAHHLASWAGVCPGTKDSAGKHLSGRTRRGSPWLRSALIEAARAAAHTKSTYLSAQYHRLAARRGAKRAALAVAHSILVRVYAILRTKTPYQDLGGTYFDERDRQAVERRLVKRLGALGYRVQLDPVVPVA